MHKTIGLDVTVVTYCLTQYTYKLLFGSAHVKFVMDQSLEHFMFSFFTKKYHEQKVLDNCWSGSQIILVLFACHMKCIPQSFCGDWQALEWDLYAVNNDPTSVGALAAGPPPRDFY